MHKTRIDLPEKMRSEVVKLLNDNLVNALDLHNQCKQAHWNVKGPNFYQLHLLFDKLSEEAREQADQIAERCTALGGTALGTTQEVGRRTALPPYPTNLAAGMAHVDALATAHAAYGKLLRAGIERGNELGDADTADLFTELSRETDKNLWFLEAHLQG